MKKHLIRNAILMAVATLKSKDELFNEGLLKERAELFKWNCYPQDFGTCLLAILAQVDYENFMTSIRLTKTLRPNKHNAKKRAVRVE